MKRPIKEVASLLAENYGLEILLEQNDIAEEFVVELLLNQGLIDEEDYFYEDEVDYDD